jgi:hypothetical protein
MRSDLFELIEAIKDLICETIDSSVEILFQLIQLISDVIQSGIDILFKGLLFLVDKERVSHLYAATDQETFSKELEVLSAVSKIKEHAIDTDDWNESHTKAIQELSSILYNECGWNETSIHVYMKQIVESVPGLEYGVEIDDEI